MRFLRRRKPGFVGQPSPEPEPLKLGKSTLYKWRDAVRPAPVVDDPAEDGANGK